MAYPVVRICNSTPYPVSGQVSYASVFCSDDQFTIAPGACWEAAGRGICLVTGITVVVVVNGNPVQAVPYISSGTSYSQFVVVQLGNDSFAVTRVTNASDSVDVGKLEAAPTEAQK
jgi:hypothetical protein